MKPVTREQFKEFLAEHKELPDYFIKIALEESEKTETPQLWRERFIDHVQFIESFLNK